MKLDEVHEILNNNLVVMETLTGSIKAIPQHILRSLSERLTDDQPKGGVLLDYQKKEACQEQFLQQENSPRESL